MSEVLSASDMVVWVEVSVYALYALGHLALLRTPRHCHQVHTRVVSCTCDRSFAARAPVRDKCFKETQLLIVNTPVVALKLVASDVRLDVRCPPIHAPLEANSAP
jgi:hypothetical protein